MRFERRAELEPLAALTPLGEFPMSLLLECAVAALEREQLVVVDASEPLPGVRARADLHPSVVSEVVDDVDPRTRQVVIGHIPVPPAADRTDPSVITTLAVDPAAQVAGPGEGGWPGHVSRG